MTEDAPELIEEMFVQLAAGMRSSPGALHLEALSPSTLYFSDRPHRVVGHMSTEQFVDQWTVGEDSFASDPPNAVLSFSVADGVMDDVVVVLRSPVVSDGGISYDVELLDGALPATAGPCTLFIDPLGRPLSPVSVAGMHRRDRRRNRRRF